MDDIPIEDAPPEPNAECSHDPRHIPPDADLRFLVRVARGDPNVLDSRADDVQVYQQAVLQIVTPGQSGQVKASECLRPKSPIAVLRIEETPVSRRELSQHREDN